MFWSDVEGKSENVDIHVMDSDGSNRINLTNNVGADTQPIWSPDGTKILFLSKRDGKNDLYVMDADGSNEVNLTNSPGADDATPIWSSDGGRIGFVSRTSLKQDLYVMNADGSNLTLLANISTARRAGEITVAAAAPSWSTP